MASPDAFSFSSQIPSWVSPPHVEPGSIDPLGYQTEVDAISNLILPGVTVYTTRIRYLSFLCWALRKTGGGEAPIYRWEIALSAGEYCRHQDPKECSYLGSHLLKERLPDPRGPLPNRLYTPSAKVRYMGLLRSSGLVDHKDELTELGEMVADAFGKGIPSRISKIFHKSRQMPCLSRAGAYELRWLRHALLESENEYSQARFRTFKEIGKGLWRTTFEEGSPLPILKKYLSFQKNHTSEVARLFHKAAVLELEALPLTRLFHFMYRFGDRIKERIPAPRQLRKPYELPDLEEDAPSFFSSLSTHLHSAERMGRPHISQNFPDLKKFILDKHYRAKPDGQWVDENWEQRRRGLAKKSAGMIHGFRLVHFASLLRDLKLI